MALITEYLQIMGETIYGATLRNATIAACTELEEATESNTLRIAGVEEDITALETQFAAEIQNITLEDPSSAEMIAARTSGVTAEEFDTIGLRLDDVEEKMLNMKANLEFDITDYGGDKTGATYSDTALAAIIALLTDGCRVVFPFGTYKFEDSHTFDTDVEIDFSNSTVYTEHANPFIFTGTLKASKTGGADYVETTSKNCLVLNSVTSILAGDLLNVISSELYDTSRDYYYKGGNVICTKVSGSAVYFNMVFPFNMTAATIAVNVYNPIQVKLRNLNLVSTAALADSENGIHVIYGANCVFENIRIDNYHTNLDIYRCVNVYVNNVQTNRAKATTADGWDGYGIACNSCTNVTMQNVITNSGQHGITTTGREPSYEIAISDSILKAEIWALALGCHGNTYSLRIKNSTLFGFLLAGNCIMENCTVLDSEIATQNVNKLIMAEGYRYGSFIFKNCDIALKVQVNDSRQIDCPTRKYIGKIIFDNCPDIIFESAIKPTSTYEKTAEVESLELIGCKGLRVDFYDRFHRIAITDCEATMTTAVCVNQLDVDDVYEYLDELFITRSKFPLRYGTITVQYGGNAVFDGFAFSTLNDGSGNGCIAVDGFAALNFTNCDMSNAALNRGIEPILDLGSLAIVNSKLKFRTTAYRDQAFLNCLMASATYLYDVELNTWMDVRTADDGNKYYVTIDALGAQVLTLIAE